VEVVHVQLPNEAAEVIVLEVLRKYLVRKEIDLLHDEPISFVVPRDYFIARGVAHNLIGL
jgi:hypothetical protein